VETWLNAALHETVRLVRRGGDEPGFADDPRINGPTVVSRGTLAEIANWLREPDVSAIRDRFRVNVVLDGVPAFFEDQLFDERPSHGRALQIGDQVVLLGAHPAHRCVVPTRCPSSTKAAGEATPGFIKSFMEWRVRSFAAWAPRNRLINVSATPSYHLSTTTIVRRGGSIAVGDLVTLGEATDLQSVLRTTRPLTKAGLLLLVDRGWMVREVAPGTRKLARFVASVLPLRLGAALVLKDVPPCVTKPTPLEVLIDLFKIALGPILLLLFLWSRTSN